ncbi:MAG: T9SS type A sorting domain-containing protein [Ignavibacteria bacterium]|nr:T9SS type A sorting domain-containing protein [Ignavibacteria bacterium]
MKTALLIVLFAITFEQSAAQYTRAYISGYSAGTAVSFLNPVTGTPDHRFAGLAEASLFDSVTGPHVSFYFLDIRLPYVFSMPRNDYHDDITSPGLDERVCYIVRCFYPDSAGAGQLTDINKEAAAVQFAIWHFQDGLQLNTISDPVIGERAEQIAELATANSHGYNVRQTVEFVMDEDPEFFSIRTTGDHGEPVAVDSIVLTYEDGILSEYNISTSLPTGLSQRIQVVYGNSGFIDAFSRKFVFPKASIFRSDSSQNPRLLLARPGTGARSFIFDWGTLPVELTSFTAEIIRGTVKLRWSTGSEVNNSHFDIQRRSLGSEWITAGRVSGMGNTSELTEYEYDDRNVPAGTYSYRLMQYDLNGNHTVYDLTEEVSVGAPSEYSLSQNYPNPFNPVTNINFSVKSEGIVSLNVYDTGGKKVAEILNGYRQAGNYRISFDAVRAGLASGVYFYRLEAGNFSRTLRMTLIK